MPHLQRLQLAFGLNLEATAGALGHRDRLRNLVQQAKTLLQRLYALLLDPIDGWLSNRRRVAFVPHGTLHQIPFAALHDGRSYLIERIEITSLPSASVLAYCRKPRERAANGSLVVGHSALGLLPGSIDEAVAVEQCYPGELLLEVEATVGNVLEKAPAASIIHLAAHGLHRADAPLFSHIQLDDGLLTALDCFGIDLDCALVTLSACETGRGVLVAGDELLGLSRALLVAGARTVLQNLWRVQDATARQLMVAFYGSLRSGETRSGALRSAQLALLNSEERAHPFFWAPMVLIGNWGVLDETRTTAVDEGSSGGH